MRVFVTGATGFIGSAIVQELLGAGHEVVGLARNEKAEAALAAAGARPHGGNLEDADSLRNGATGCDAVIHAGFIHDFSRFAEVCEVDRRAIEILGAALAGSEKQLIVTSGIGLLPQGEFSTEAAMPVAGHSPRIATEEAADAVAATGVRISVVRLPPSVHGEGDHGFVPMLVGIARKEGASVYNSERLNQWPAVHRLDAARLYRLALDTAATPGTRYHSAAEEGILFRDIAEVIGRRLNVPVIAKSGGEAAAHFGFFAPFAAMDIRASSAQTRQALGWRPTQPGLLTDMDNDYYFQP